LRIWTATIRKKDEAQEEDRGVVLLGIDPGCRFAGFGILKKEGGKTFLVEHGLLKLNPSEHLAKRIHQFHDFFQEKIIKHQVTHLALETPFLGKNAQNFLKLGYLRGILYLLASRHNLILQEFAPRQVKLSLTGFGGAEKDQVARVISHLFPGINPTLKDDVTDALAVTVCGLWSFQTTSL